MLMVPLALAAVASDTIPVPKTCAWPSFKRFNVPVPSPPTESVSFSNQRLPIPEIYAVPVAPAALPIMPLVLFRGAPPSIRSVPIAVLPMIMFTADPQSARWPGKTSPEPTMDCAIAAGIPQPANSAAVASMLGMNARAYRCAMSAAVLLVAILLMRFTGRG
ncbi:hypothetical protein D3C71_1513210 [compost metagenome]